MFDRDFWFDIINVRNINLETKIMSKKQKIWLWVFLAMFIIPEVLWSPVGNFVYSWIMPTVNGSIQTMRNNFLMSIENVNLYTLVLFIQLVGISLVFIYLIIVRKNIEKIPFWVGVLSALFLSVITFFCFGLSISLRHIGF